MWTNGRAVLDPIITTGMTAADVPELAVRAHRLMENALREISTHVEPIQDSTADAPLSSQLPLDLRDVHESTEDKRVINDSSQSLSSIVRRRNSEGGSTAETESDEGMVLVGHPPT